MNKTEWFGEIPSSWSIFKIQNLFRNRNVKVSDKDYVPLSVTKSGIYPQLENVAKSNDSDNRKLVCTGDFVINSRSDRKQSCGVSPYDGSVSLINTVIYPFKNIVDMKYIGFLFDNYGFAEEFYRWGHGIVADLWTTRWQEMANIEIPIPSLFEQKKIYLELSEKTIKIDQLIANQQQQIEKLKEYKKSLISKVVNKGLDSNVLYMDSGVEWIGQIPKHWKITRNKYVMNKKKLIINAATELPVLSLSVNGVIIRDIDNPKGKMPTTFDGYQEVFPNNLLLCLFDIDVTPCCVGHIENHGITSPAYSQFELSNDSSSRYYYYLLLNIDYQKSYLHLSKNLRSSLTEDLFGAIPTIQPPYSEQLQIANYIEEKFKKIDDLILKKIKKLDNIQDYKKTLVYEYVTGKKEIS